MNLSDNMKSKIIILQHKGFFTQHLNEYKNIDMSLVCDELNRAGFDVDFLEYNKLAEFDYQVDESAIYWTGSHQNISVKHYINDVLTARFIARSNLVPALDTVLAHENKGIMGILAAEKSLSYISQDYRIETEVKDRDDIKFPFVYKSLGGAGSKGVALVGNKKELSKSILASKVQDISIKEIKEGAKNLLRKILRRGEQADYLSQQARYCEQEFIPNLGSDFKVLVFWEKVFVLKRAVRDGDFRASGSGRFEIQEKIDPKLAQLAVDCRRRLNSPYCSLDFVILESGQYKLIEFQTCHFGPYTQLSSICFYNKKNISDLNPKSFEEELTSSIISYVHETTI